MQQIKKILFILTLLISSLVSQVLAEGVSCYRSGGVTDNEDPELNQFYYHSDHLGSSSYITNLKGSIVQHVEYVPFGEVFLEERNNKWNTPYLFNGKELDEETGFYYYGARYYSSRNSIFLSVDPLWEAKPSFSPYNYCSWNPVMRVDPDGRLDDWVETPAGKKKYYENIHSERDMKKNNIDGKYLGKTYKKGNKYYSLFGQVKDYNTKEGKLYEKIDQTLINYANYIKEYKNNMWEEPIEKSTDFNIGIDFKKNKLGISESNIYTFTYEGATGYYFVFGNKNRMKAKLNWGKNRYNANKNYGFGDMKSGYNTHIYLSRSPRLDIVTLVFPSLGSKKALYGKWKNEFFPKSKK